MTPKLLKTAYEENGSVLRLSVDVGERRPHVYRALLSHAPALETLTEDTFLDEDALRTLEQENTYCDATAKALRLLAGSDHSVRALTRKLCERGVDREVAATVAGEMRDLGYIREESQAARLVVTRAHAKLWGPRRLIPDLVSKGYPPATVRAAILQAEEEGDLDFAAIRARLLESKLDGQATAEDRKKLLYKHGF